MPMEQALSGSWKLTLPCTRAEAEAIGENEFALAEFDPVPVLMTSERVSDDAEQWQLDAYFEERPDPETIAAVRALVPSAGDIAGETEPVEEEDWVTLSQAGIEPVATARFYVHTSANRGEVPAGKHRFLIEAGRAFGTGQHDTTLGCLKMLEGMKARGLRFHNVADVGTGTGLLAFAALHLWPAAAVAASDIDPVAMEVTHENALANRVPLGRLPGQLALATAAGVDHPLLVRRAPYDLVIANILAGPLVELAPSLTRVLAEGGTLILAGLLDRQLQSVATAYRRRGMRLAGRIEGEWPALRLVKRTRFGVGRVRRPGPDGPGLAPGFGSW
ncbi:MAG: 50S ribosomal protein L11 methyltransferase [Sphingomonas sp.]|nr:50S ribosomal protein L11 methyltransferase [Sphingomonas sp.]MAW99021.1 50S ribosomal protein L11 methyltransferase [Sphingomonas sp.]